MLSEFFQKFRKTPQEAPALPELDGRIAMGVLLVRLAKADQNYAVEEIAMIDRLFSRYGNLNPVEAAKARATCEKLEAEAPDTSELTALVREGVSSDTRLQMLSALWGVSRADGIVRDEESCFVTHVARELGLTRDDITNANGAP
ncbi:TerB family tellurite resistance protein [Aliiroseovarius crassostreae]|uniref:tellurite resistance TerB family protein n=1 Tax=Aliiroseovarius crassostreae TaxID=154981 RepID=UPI00220C3A5F|nr:TerB family tellurite resistance protein [Aliiroseovarius crassostreae]UWQ10082.1 TerB family tellurite resistance protein [Aliiroseovarius crassostreae]